MASTEVALGSAQLAGCMALSKSASWNQNEADWRLMLELGSGWGIQEADGTLSASTLVLPYGGRFAWIAMVLVLPEHRRKGYATRLLRLAVAELKRRGLTPVLDATPAGREVYRLEGFQDRWGFKRYAVARKPGLQKHECVRRLHESDWPALLEMDRAAFGGDREKLLRALSKRLCEAALVFEREGRIEGFLLGREGRESNQLGPLIARDGDVAQALLLEGLERAPVPLYLDVADHASRLAAGFQLQRPFTRMVHGGARAPGDERAVFLVAGPELG
jgi:GNAT superfamily N-acetyltransferase